MRILNFSKNPDHISKTLKKKLKRTGVNSWKFVLNADPLDIKKISIYPTTEFNQSELRNDLIIRS
jgi:hypothetical protein